MSTPKEQMKRALQQYLVPSLRSLGFSGGLAGFRRLGARGVDVLVVPTFKGVVQLDAGRVKRRATLGARTVRQDWATYAGTASGASRRRLETAAGKGVWRYDDLRAPGDFDRVAKALVRVVERAGVAFWEEGGEAPSKRTVAKTKAVDRTRAVKALVVELLVPRLRALGFAGSFAGSAGAFRRIGKAVELVSVSLGGESLLVQVAARVNARRSGAKTPSTDFLMAPDRDDLFDESYAEASAAGLRTLVRAALRAIEGPGLRYLARQSP